MQQREIKFRAWDGAKMTDAIRLEFAHGLRLVSTSDFGFGMIGDDKCVLMQFTGLRDKNGKEIYEGDIVKQTQGNFVVEYHEGSASFIFTVDPNDKDALSFRLSSERDQRALEVSGLEVIGNVYESPDLIK